MQRGVRPLLVPGIVLLVTFGTLVSGALIPRDLSLGEDAPIWNTNRDLVAFDLSRAATAVVLFASVATITVAVIRRGFPRAGLSIWLSYLAFILSNFVLPGIAGRIPVFDYRLLLPPVAFTAFYFARPMAIERLVTLCKAALLAFVYGSLLGAVVLPAQALAAGYEGLIPGLDARLYGIGGGATSLGTLSSIYLAIETVSPSRARTRYLHLAAAAAALVLTQAKTSWLFALAVVGYWGFRRLRHRLPSLAVGAGVSARVTRILLLSCGAAVLVGLAALYVGRADFTSLRGGENLLTLTGRTYIWATSLTVWLDDPVFGYGLGLWESEGFRARYGGFDHSHNQFIHSLASAGVFGLLGLLAYLRAALVTCARAARTSAVPLVLLAGVLVLCLTNTPLRAYYVLDAFALLHLLLFAFLMQAEKPTAT